MRGSSSAILTSEHFSARTFLAFNFTRTNHAVAYCAVQNFAGVVTGSSLSLRRSAVLVACAGDHFFDARKILGQWFAARVGLALGAAR